MSRGAMNEWVFLFHSEKRPNRRDRERQNAAKESRGFGERESFIGQGGRKMPKRETRHTSSSEFHSLGGRKAKIDDDDKKECHTREEIEKKNRPPINDNRNGADSLEGHWEEAPAKNAYWERE